MITELPEHGDYLVQVSAQVMTRDDSTGGWVPVGGGGLSRVKLCRLAPVDNSGSPGEGNNNAVRQQITAGSVKLKPEYIIQGERVADNAIILDCKLKRDIQYTKANPNWHHWKTGNKKYGLTFECSEDARAFDHGIRIAVADLTGEKDNGAEETAGSQDRIFSYVSLSLVRNDSSSRSASTASTTTSSPGTNSPQSPNNDSFGFANPQSHLHRVHYFSSPRLPAGDTHTKNGDSFRLETIVQQAQQPQESHNKAGSPVSEKFSQHSFDSGSGQDDVWVKHKHLSSLSWKSEQGLIECDTSDREHKYLYKEESYVVFNKNKVSAPHDYSYPNLEPAPKPTSHRSSGTRVQTAGALQSHMSQPCPPLPIKNKSKSKGGNAGSGSGWRLGKAGTRCPLVSSQVQCKHCREVFSLDNNPRGSCEDAPDSVARCIELVTCVSCTQGLMYHCWADADGEYRHPCSCDADDPKLCKRWTALTFLSFFLPCLWCYLPLRACHYCGTTCGLCGGRHKAA